MLGDIISMLFALAGTVCIILLTYYASKWYVRRMGPIAGGRHIKVVDRLVVSKTGSILIIDVEGTQYMVGVSDQNIQIMKQMEDSIPLPEEPELGQRLGPELKGMLRALKKWRGVD